ncbi:MAG: zinc ribbon domain-containing protein [Desulfobacteraceae bacterium]
MICPKCRYEQDDQNIECVRCGIVFAKFLAARQSNPRENRRGSIDEAPKEKRSGISMADLFFYTHPENNILLISGRGAVLIVLIIWGFKFMVSPLEENYAGASFMHLVNLPFHEAGHIFFRFLGSFLAALGGTLGQFLMPLVCLAVFLLKTRDPFGAAVALWWLGQNFFDIAPYINDARSLSLPLLGGNTGHSSPYGFHDWEYLLTESGLLPYDHVLAKLCVFAGAIIFFISFAWGAILLHKQYKTLSP